MKQLLAILILSCLALSAASQGNETKMQLKLDEAKARLEDFDTEHLLDSIDQEKLPRMVSGGVLAGMNISNFIITRDHRSMSSYMRVGGELGGFLDFTVTKHFAVQPQVIFTAHQNHFAATDTTNHLWSFGAEYRFISLAVSVILSADISSSAEDYSLILPLRPM